MGFYRIPLEHSKIPWFDEMWSVSSWVVSRCQDRHCVNKSFTFHREVACFSTLTQPPHFIPKNHSLGSTLAFLFHLFTLCESLSYLNYNFWLRMQAVDQRELLGISIEPVRSTVGLIGPHRQTRVVQIPKVLSTVLKLASVRPCLLLWFTLFTMTPLSFLQKDRKLSG